MARRSVLAGFVVACGSLLGAAVFRRRSARRRERVDLYYGDGTFVSLGDRSPEVARLTGLAHEFLRSARL
jgi:hypothetical protein